MNTNIITSEERYTYERIHKALKNERKEKIKNILLNTFYELKKRSIGIGLTAITIINPIVTKDLTLSIITSLFAIPLLLGMEMEE